MAQQPFEIRLELDAESRKYLRDLASLVGRDALYSRLDVFLQKQSLIAAGHISKTMLSGNPIHRRTGSLAKSVVGVSTRKDGVPAMKVGVLRGPALKYAEVLEKGTVGKGGDLPTIRPRNAKALALPTDEVKTPAGVDRYGGPRQYPGQLQFVPFRRSGIAIGGLYDAAELARAAKSARRTGESPLQNISPAYVLLRKLDIKPYRWLSGGFKTYLPQLLEALKVFLRDLLRQSKRSSK